MLILDEPAGTALLTRIFANTWCDFFQRLKMKGNVSVNWIEFTHSDSSACEQTNRRAFNCESAALLITDKNRDSSILILRSLSTWGL